MKEIPISAFKRNCFEILRRVQKTRVPVRIIRFGKPVAEIVPPSVGKQGARRLGSMAGTGLILGDLVGPTGSLDDWEAWRD
jgi:prevent-host-death family protein